MLTGLAIRPRVKRILTATALGVVVAQLVVIAHRRATNIGDFDITREFGRRFVAGEYLYRGGLHYPYMPSAAMIFAPLVCVPPTVGLTILYFAAIGCLLLTLRMLFAMVRGANLALASRAFEVGLFTVALASHYIIRDLDDGGPNLIVLAMIVGGVYCVWRASDRAGSFLFGLGIAIKATAALFLPFFVWKREWRLAGSATLAAAVLIVSPALRMGPRTWWQHQVQWFRSAVGFFVGRNPAATQYYGDLITRNQALKPAIVQLLGGGATSASVASPVAIVLLVGVFCLFTRARYAARGDPRWLLECSAALIVALLLSPSTWVQHIVLIIPAIYLIVAEDVGIAPLGRTASIAIIAFAGFTLVLNREIVGRSNYETLLRWHLHTLCMLLVLAILILRRPTAAASATAGA